MIPPRNIELHPIAAAIRALVIVASCTLVWALSGCTPLSDYGADVQITVTPAPGTKWISTPVVATDLRDRLRHFRLPANVEVVGDGVLHVLADARAERTMVHLLAWDGGLSLSKPKPANDNRARSEQLHLASDAVAHIGLGAKGRTALVEVPADAYATIAEFASNQGSLSVELAGANVGTLLRMSDEQSPEPTASALVIGFGDDLAAFSRAAEFVRLMHAPGVPKMQVSNVTRIPLGIGRAALVFILPLLVSMGWLVFVRRFDRLRPEPKATVAVTFVLGLLAAGPAWTIEFYAGKLSPFLNPAVMTLGRQWASFPVALCSFTIVVGAVEETLKFLAVVAFAKRRVEFDEPIDGIVYAAAASLGFAAIENIHQFTVGDFSSGLFALRALMTVPAHLFFSSLWGFALGETLVSRRARVFPALALAALAHGAFDAALSVRHMKPLAIGLSVLLAFLFTLAVRRSLREPGSPAHPSDEPLMSRRPRSIVVIRDERWATAHGAVLALSAGASVYLAGNFDSGLHRASTPAIAASLLLCGAMSLALYRFADAIPLDVAIDDHGITWSGRMVPWRNVTDVREVTRHRRSFLEISGEDSPLVIGPGKEELLRTAVAQINGWRRARRA